MLIKKEVFWYLPELDYKKLVKLIKQITHPYLRTEHNGKIFNPLSRVELGTLQLADTLNRGVYYILKIELRFIAFSFNVLGIDFL